MRNCHKWWREQTLHSAHMKFFLCHIFCFFVCFNLHFFFVGGTIFALDEMRSILHERGQWFLFFPAVQLQINILCLLSIALRWTRSNSLLVNPCKNVLVLPLYSLYYCSVQVVCVQIQSTWFVTPCHTKCHFFFVTDNLTFYTDRKMIARRDAWVYLYIPMHLLISVIILPGSVHLGIEQISLIILAVIVKQQWIKLEIHFAFGLNINPNCCLNISFYLFENCTFWQVSKDNICKY